MKGMTCNFLKRYMKYMIIFVIDYLILKNILNLNDVMQLMRGEHINHRILEDVKNQKFKIL